VARAREQRAAEVFALYDIARFGRPELVADRLAGVAASMEGRFAPVAAASAAALVAGDGVALDGVAATFEELGAPLLAAEAAAAAARAHQASAGRPAPRGRCCGRPRWPAPARAPAPRPCAPASRARC
jgi:hypothetical protein